jgi:hypothetical protein
VERDCFNEIARCETQEKGNCTVHPPSYASAEMVVREKRRQKRKFEREGKRIEIVVSERLAMQCTNSRVDRGLGERELVGEV